MITTQNNTYKIQGTPSVLLKDLKNQKRDADQHKFKGMEHNSRVLLAERGRWIWLGFLPDINGVVIHHHHENIRIEQPPPDVETYLSLNGMSLNRPTHEKFWIPFVPEMKHPFGRLIIGANMILLIIDRTKFDPQFKAYNSNIRLQN